MTSNRSEGAWDPGMHVTWLVRDIAAFQEHPGPTSPDDLSLEFGVTYNEWYALFFDVLRADKGEYERWLKDHPNEAQNSISPIEFDEDVEGYPMLSRIRGYLYDAIFEVAEIEQLRQECLRVQSTTSNALALQGVNKLLRICDEAQNLNLNIYLMCE